MKGGQSGSSPRVRGTLSRHRFTVPASGSSPRVRGTRFAGERVGQFRGIIPACAGNTSQGRGWSAWHWDHPRVCGEHVCFVVPVVSGGGSSPRVRGTHCKLRSGIAGQGIIPACAGNTGELVHVVPTGRGSSPRVRGTPLHRILLAGVSLIIPACAGNTDHEGEDVVWVGDHPRVCGEHDGKDVQGGGGQGSSPRVRGTPHASVLHRNDDGIIPACAGNTDSLYQSVHLFRDHPRVCGEHRVGDNVCKVRPGSSPRVRGTHAARAANRMAGGIIPACAGNTSMPYEAHTNHRDHPRVCGEHDLINARAEHG